MIAILAKNTAIKAAKAAGALIRKGFYGSVVRYRYKDPYNIVTEVDIGAERTILRIIQKKFPSHSFVLEEHDNINTSSEYCWFIDPLDGTTNFSRKFPYCCVSIALAHKGKLILGLIYDPIHNELFSAEIGKGAQLNGKKIRAGNITALRKALIVTGRGASQAKNLRFIKLIKAFLPHVRSVRTPGSAALELCYAACGRFDAVALIGSNVYDYAAGLLIAKEAGAVGTDFLGRDPNLKSSNILVANKKLHKVLLRKAKKL